MCRRRIDGEREHRLTHRHVDPRVEGPLTLLAKARMLVVLAAERDDHAKHRHGLMDDRQRLAFHPLHVQQPLADVRAVVADRVVQERDDRQRQQRERRVQPIRHPEHPDERQDVLRERQAAHHARSRRAPASELMM